MMQPTHIYHADWGTAANKRWLALATLGSDRRYSVEPPRPVGDNIIPSIRKQISGERCALIGFDFPIGVPASYARVAGVTNFKSFLKELGNGKWADFYSVARAPSEITTRRPFYPFAPGQARQTHLLSALGLDDIDGLRRECERQHAGRRAACPLFWTLGANQVGKGALIGWRHVLAPTLRDDEAVLVWPFDGHLDELLRPGNAPAARVGHSAVWTGSEMIVWGGAAPASLNTGGRYDPATNTWTATNTSDAPVARINHSTVWTGSAMIVWGGQTSFPPTSLGTGGRYDPATDTWVSTNTSDGPAARTNHSAVWTGSEMIVWGGGAPLTNAGGRYDPPTDTWRATDTDNAPSARYSHTAVWTGSEMIVWGGAASLPDPPYPETGGRYCASAGTLVPRLPFQ